MNKREIEKQIPIAIDLIKVFIHSEKFYKNNDKNFGGIPNEYKGYISNLGASIVQSGLISTLAFFEAEESKANCDRSVLTELILKVICENKELKSSNNTLLSYALEETNKERDVKEEVINAAIAVKLAMRVFKFTANDESQVNPL